MHPSFSPHGLTQPVTLLIDDVGVTQLAGDPGVAWQIPWSEFKDVRLLHSRSGACIIGVVAGVVYQWRRSEPLNQSQFGELRAILTTHGARETPRARRTTAWAVAAIVTLASFGGYFGAVWHHQQTSTKLAALEALNLSVRDVAGSWSSSSLASSSLLTSLVPPPGQVQTANPATTTSAPPSASPFALAAVHFQRCLPVASVDDRLFGAAGTVPNYQVTSPVFYSSDFGGVQVVSTAQYYDSAPSVAQDIVEMSRSSFGRCFAQAAGDELVGAASGATPDLTNGMNFTIPTFVKGWSRAGVVEVSLASLQDSRAHLVFVEEAAGHYEVTLFALAINLPRATSIIHTLTNALLARVTSDNVVSA